MLPQAQRTAAPFVGAYMTAHPITVDAAAPVAEAAALLRSCRVRHLPVLDETKLVGVISVRDVIGADERRRVAELVPRDLVTAEPGWTVDTACEQLIERHLSCLPVVDAVGPGLVGIFTATDALRVAADLFERERTASLAMAQVSRLMTARPLATVQPASTLSEAWQLMQSASLHHLPVVDGDHIVGILCDRDVLAVGRSWLQAPTGDSAILVADAMSPRVVTIQADRPALEAARLLLARRLGALPVLHGAELRGILTVRDFLYWILSVS